MATINLAATTAIELADILDFIAEWIAEADEDAFACWGYTIDELHAVLTSLADQLRTAKPHP